MAITVTINGGSPITINQQSVSPTTVNLSAASAVNVSVVGATGPTGPAGAAGQGVPVGGVEGQVILKQSATDYDTAWDYVESVYAPIENNEGSVMSAGTPVYAKGISGNRILVGAACANDTTKMPAIGILLEETADGATGEIITAGLFNKTVTGLTGVSVGDTVYVTNAGTLGVVRPTAATDGVQNIGVVLQTSGSNIQKMKVSAIDRVNDIPNLASGVFFIGGATGQLSPYTLPIADGTANQFLKTDGAGAVTFTSITQATGNELENVVEDTTPQLGGDLDAQSNNITNLGSLNGTAASTIISGAAAGATTLQDVVDDTTPQLGGTLDSNGNEIRFRGTGHTNYVAIAPSALEPGSSVTFYPPIADGTTGQVIQTNGSGRLSFTDQTDTTYTAGDGLDLAGTEFSADLKANGGIVVESTELAVDLGASSITGTLGITDGGTGQTTQQAALDAITNASSGTTGQVLTTDGTNASWQTASGGGGSNKTAYIFHYADTGTSSKFFVADTLTEISSEDYRTRTPMVEAGEITKAMIATNATTPSGNDYRLNIYLNGVATYSANATADTVAGDGRIQFTFSSATVSAGDVVSFRISGTASATANLPVSIGSAVLCVIKQDS
jgi:hypothetical protein